MLRAGKGHPFVSMQKAVLARHTFLYTCVHVIRGEASLNTDVMYAESGDCMAALLNTCVGGCIYRQQQVVWSDVMITYTIRQATIFEPGKQSPHDLCNGYLVVHFQCHSRIFTLGYPISTIPRVNYCTHQSWVTITLATLLWGFQKDEHVYTTCV